jgi:hypothetical protein
MAMKVYTIGRDVSCNIVIDDRTDVISRRHATLTVAPSGKMTITDLSYNGTYVNGIRISQNVPVPVTRNDNVSFAHIARLDWNLIPDTRATYLRYALMGLLAIVLVVGGVLGFNALNSGSNNNQQTPMTVVKADSANNEDAKKKAEELAKEEKQKQDSIKKHVEDSIKKVNNARRNAEKKKSGGDKKVDKKTADDKDKKKDDKKVTRRH